MANTQAFCSQAKVDMMNGKHALGASVIRAATTKDEYKAALYLDSATRGAGDTVYSATGEVSGTGYTAGGVVVTTATGPQLDTTTAHFTPSASIVYSTVTLSTTFDAVLLYNNTSAAKLALSVHTFTGQTVTAGDFTLTMPTDDGTTGLVRIAQVGSQDVQTLKQIRSCDGSCCIEAPRFPFDDGTPGCRFSVSGTCQILNGNDEAPDVSPALSNMTGAEAVEFSCTNWPQNDPGCDTGDCCWKWVNNG